MHELDNLDLAILKIIQQDNTVAQRDIGEAIGLSAAAVQRRIKRMTTLGIIRANVALLDRHQLGHSVTLFVEVNMEREKLSDIEEAKDKFRNRPEVQHCYYVTGDADFVLIIIVPSMHDYERLTRELFFSNPNIKNFKTFVVMDMVKTDTQIPLA